MIWWITVASILAFLILFIVFIVAFGIQVSVYFNYTTMSGCADIYIFNKLLMLKLRFFECNQKLYIQLNRKDLKQIKKQSKAKLNLDLTKIPKIKLNKFHFACVFGNNDLAVLGQIFGIASASLPCIDLLFSKNIKVKDKKIRLYPMYTYNNLQLNSQIIIKFSIFKIMFFILHTLIKTRIKNKKVKVKLKNEISHAKI